MHPPVQEFVGRVLTSELVAGKSVLEVGSYDVNGSVRPQIEGLLPLSYLGVDMQEGPRVDVVCDATDLSGLQPYGWDIVVSCEMMEHCLPWREAINAMKLAVNVGGYLLITCRSKGFGHHGYPDDHWRFELVDMGAIFSDFEVLECCTDPGGPGVFLFARKIDNGAPIDLSGIELYSMKNEV